MWNANSYMCVYLHACLLNACESKHFLLPLKPNRSSENLFMQYSRFIESAKHIVYQRLLVISQGFAAVLPNCYTCSEHTKFR